MNNLISVIVPVYNSQEWIEKCINSIISQTYECLEIILVDDGSTDESSKICDKYAKKDKRIKVIHKKNGGVSTARNCALKIAKGNYIKFVDSDDTLQPDCCEMLYNYISKENIDLVICGLNVYKNNELLRTPHLEEKMVSPIENINDFKYIGKVFASPCNKLYKKELIKDLFEEKMTAGEDMLFNIRYLNECNMIKCIPNCLYNVCLDNNNSLNRKFREDRLEITLQLNKIQRDFCNVNYKDYDDTFLNNDCLLGVHSYFRDIVKYKNFSFFKKQMKVYLKNETINKSLRNYNFERKDYNIFCSLFKKKLVLLLYLFFTIKIKLKG